MNTDTRFPSVLLAPLVLLVLGSVALACKPSEPPTVPAGEQQERDQTGTAIAPTASYRHKFDLVGEKEVTHDYADSPLTITLQAQKYVKDSTVDGECGKEPCLFNHPDVNDVKEVHMRLDRDDRASPVLVLKWVNDLDPKFEFKDPAPKSTVPDDKEKRTTFTFAIPDDGKTVEYNLWETSPPYRLKVKITVQ